LCSYLLKPDSAQQEEREIYIGGGDGSKRSPNESMMSLGDVKLVGNTSIFGKKRRKSNLPSIKGVNRQSIGLLID